MITLVASLQQINVNSLADSYWQTSSKLGSEITDHVIVKHRPVMIVQEQQLTDTMILALILITVITVAGHTTRQCKNLYNNDSAYNAKAM